MLACQSIHGLQRRIDQLEAHRVHLRDLVLQQQPEGAFLMG